MARQNTAHPIMIEDFKALKQRGIKDFYLGVIVKGQYKGTQTRHTAQGVSSFANQMYVKYGFGTDVTVTYYDPEKMDFVLYTTYSA